MADTSELKRMKSGLVSISFRQLAPWRIVELVAEAGLQGIEWGGDVHVPHGDLVMAEEVAKLTTNKGLKVASYGSYYRFEECDLDSDVGGPTMQSVLDTAEALGAPAIRVWAGQRGPGQTSPEVWGAIVTRAREFAEESARRGMRLDLEFHENTLTETPESTCRFLEEVGHPGIRTLWQPALMTSPADRLAGLRRVKGWVSNIHCNHFDQDPWPDIHALEEGAGEWPNYLAELDSIQDERWVLIEHIKEHSPEQFQADAAALLSWLPPS